MSLLESSPIHLWIRFDTPYGVVFGLDLQACDTPPGKSALGKPNL
jgi:hypothetical protein